MLKNNSFNRIKPSLNGCEFKIKKKIDKIVNLIQCKKIKVEKKNILEFGSD